MASPTPAGDMSLCLDHLKEMIAASSTFQAAIGAEDATEAKAKIFKLWADNTSESQQRPRCIINHMEAYASRRESTGGYRTTGILRALVEIDIPEEHLSNPADAYVWFTNILGGIINDLFAMAWTSGRIKVDAVEVSELDGPADPNNNNGDQFWAVELAITFG